jgi:hypothetical protein
MLLRYDKLQKCHLFSYPVTIGIMIHRHATKHWLLIGKLHNDDHFRVQQLIKMFSPYFKTV